MEDSSQQDFPWPQSDVTVPEGTWRCCWLWLSHWWPCAQHGGVVFIGVTGVWWAGWDPHSPDGESGECVLPCWVLPPSQAADGPTEQQEEGTEMRRWG